MRFRGVSVRVKSRGLSRVRANLERIDGEIPQSMSATIRQAVIAGKKFAQAIAPKDTGALIRAIRYSTAGKAARRVGKVTSTQPDHPVKGKAIPYHVIMHDRPMDFDYSGEPQYMYATYEFLSKNFPKQMERAVKVAISGTGFSTTEVDKP